MHKNLENRRSFLAGWLLTCMMGLFLSCTQPKKKNVPSANSPEYLDTTWKKPPASFSDTLVIHFPAAVFYNPDSLQLKKINEILPENEYETEVHNGFYMMRNARMVLKKYWPSIQIIETSVNRFLRFVKADKTATTIDLDRKGDISGLFLFDGKKEPELVDMMNIDTALRFYFGN